MHSSKATYTHIPGRRRKEVVLEVVLEVVPFMQVRIQTALTHMKGAILPLHYPVIHLWRTPDC